MELKKATVVEPVEIKGDKTYFVFFKILRDRIIHGIIIKKKKMILSIQNISKTYPNGGQVLKDGEHTGATPGKVVRGPGYKK